jgi:hypothetical protein
MGQAAVSHLDGSHFGKVNFFHKVNFISCVRHGQRTANQGKRAKSTQTTATVQNT